MGSVLTYTCKKCGYKSSVMTGCGLYSLQKNLMPALDKAGKKLVAIDTNAPPANMDNYVLYSDLTLNRKPFFRFMPHLLQDGAYPLLAKYNLCPKCGRYCLSCGETGLWD